MRHCMVSRLMEIIPQIFRDLCQALIPDIKCIRDDQTFDSTGIHIVDRLSGMPDPIHDRSVQFIRRRASACHCMAVVI